MLSLFPPEEGCHHFHLERARRLRAAPLLILREAEAFTMDPHQRLPDIQGPSQQEWPRAVRGSKMLRQPVFAGRHRAPASPKARDNGLTAMPGMAFALSANAIAWLRRGQWGTCIAHHLGLRGLVLSSAWRRLWRPTRKCHMETSRSKPQLSRPALESIGGMARSR